MAKAKDAFREAFRVAGNEPEIAKIHFYQGLSLLAEDIEKIIVLLQGIKDATQDIVVK